jgi:cytochrome c
LIGPSFAAIAKKYKNNTANINYLSTKIIKGGSGKWGQVPMTPHPTISKKDADEMVRFILSKK